MKQDVSTRGGAVQEFRASTEPERQPDRTQGILVLRDGKPEPMIPTSNSPHATTLVAPGIMIERHAFSALEVSRHFHPTHCLHLQTAGICRVRWSAEGTSGTETMRVSSLMLHGQGTWDSMAFGGDSSRIVVSLDPACMTKMLRGDREVACFQIPSRWHFQDRQLEGLVRNLELEAGNDFHTGRLYAELLGLSLFEYLMQHYSHTRLLQPSGKGGLPKRRLDRVLEYIAANLSQSLSLMELAAIAGMSAYHFARLFKLSTGLTPHQYVLTQRMERAKHLLLRGQCNVTDVAFESGFNDLSYFSRMFRKATGISPARYRGNRK